MRKALALARADRLAPCSFRSLSSGERQRMLLARAIAQSPKILLLDEPTSHLDVGHQLDVIDSIKALGLTVVAALHDLNVALTFADEALILSERDRNFERKAVAERARGTGGLGCAEDFRRRRRVMGASPSRSVRGNVGLKMRSRSDVCIAGLEMFTRGRYGLKASRAERQGGCRSRRAPRLREARGRRVHAEVFEDLRCDFGIGDEADGRERSATAAAFETVCTIGLHNCNRAVPDQLQSSRA